MRTVRVSRKALKAALVAAATDDTRLELCGVAVDRDGSVTAIDGHRLHYFAPIEGAVIDGGEAPEGVNWPVVIGRDTVTGIRATARRSGVAGILTVHPEECIDLTPVGEGRVESSVEGGARCSWPLLGGSFPNWRRVIPSGPVSRCISFNAEYLRDALQSLGAVENGFTRRVTFCLYGSQKGALLLAGDGDAGGGAFGLVMPLRLPDGDEAPLGPLGDLVAVRDGDGAVKVGELVG